MAARSRPTVSEPDTDAIAKAKADAEQADKAVADEVAAAAAVELEQGFRGLEVDPTPNENYTLAGVTAGKPTPETDVEAREAARKAARGVEAQAAGVTEG